MAEPAYRYVNLEPGEPAPGFRQRTSANPRFVFDTVGGRWVVLCFFGSAADPAARRALDAVLQHRALFDDVRASFFGVSADPADEAEGRVRDAVPGLRFFWDFDLTASRLYGAAEAEGAAGPYRPLWVIADPTLRIRSVHPFRNDGRDAAEVLDALAALPPPDRYAGWPVQAPVLFLPNVFEPELCRALVEAYEAAGGEESGFMREVEGRTVLVKDASHKRRRDHTVVNPELIRATQQRIARRIAPEIRKVHQFEVTRMERYLVACYAAEDQGHFRPHRDNTTKGTAHRRFAVSVNLNEDFDGGEIGFPEYGPRTYKPAPGSAVVFSCSLLHAVTPVTRGRRYAFLPFLYDEAAAKIREANIGFLDAGGSYSAGA